MHPLIEKMPTPVVLRCFNHIGVSTTFKWTLLRQVNAVVDVSIGNMQRCLIVEAQQRGPTKRPNKEAQQRGPTKRSRRSDYEEFANHHDE